MYDNLSGPYIGCDIKTIKVGDNRGEWGFGGKMLVLLCIFVQVHDDINISLTSFFDILYMMYNMWMWMCWRQEERKKDKGILISHLYQDMKKAA